MRRPREPDMGIMVDPVGMGCWSNCPYFSGKDRDCPVETTFYTKTEAYNLRPGNKTAHNKFPYESTERSVVKEVIRGKEKIVGTYLIEASWGVCNHYLFLDKGVVAYRNLIRIREGITRKRTILTKKEMKRKQELKRKRKQKSRRKK